MAAAVVDALEIVEIDQHDRQLLAVALGELDRQREALLHRDAVRQSGQRVVLRHVAQLLDDVLALAHLRLGIGRRPLERIDPVGERERQQQDIERQADVQPVHGHEVRGHQREIAQRAERNEHEQRRPGEQEEARGAVAVQHRAHRSVEHDASGRAANRRQSAHDDAVGNQQAGGREEHAGRRERHHRDQEAVDEELRSSPCSRKLRANCAPNSSVAHNAVPSAWFAHHTLSGQRYWKPRPSKVARPTPNEAT